MIKEKGTTRLCYKNARRRKRNMWNENTVRLLSKFWVWTSWQGIWKSILLTENGIADFRSIVRTELKLRRISLHYACTSLTVIENLTAFLSSRTTFERNYKRKLATVHERLAGKHPAVCFTMVYKRELT